MIDNNPPEDYTLKVTYTHKIGRQGPTEVVSKVLVKDYRPVYDKRIVANDYNTIHWGYSRITTTDFSDIEMSPPPSPLASLPPPPKKVKSQFIPVEKEVYIPPVNITKTAPSVLKIVGKSLKSKEIPALVSTNEFERSSSPIFARPAPIKAKGCTNYSPVASSKVRQFAVKRKIDNRVVDYLPFSNSATKFVPYTSAFKNTVVAPFQPEHAFIKPLKVSSFRPFDPNSRICYDVEVETVAKYTSALPLNEKSDHLKKKKRRTFQFSKK